MEMNLGQWLEKWFNVYSQIRIKQSTCVSYYGYIYNHIMPDDISQIKLSKLNTDIFQDFFSSVFGNVIPQICTFTAPTVSPV